MSSGSARCTHTKSDGVRCKANSLKQSKYCFFHDPQNNAKRSAAQKKGGCKGSRKILPINSPILPLQTAQDVVTLLGGTISQVSRGELDTRIANTVGYLCGVLLRAREQGDLESRLEILERGLSKELS